MGAKTKPDIIPEDRVRNAAGKILRLDKDHPSISAGTGQVMTFNQLGFTDQGKSDKPDGWYLPDDISRPAFILETKNSGESVRGEKPIAELKKNCQIAAQKYANVVGVLYNGKETICFRNSVLSDGSSEFVQVEVPKELQDVSYYLGLFDTPVDKQGIYQITQNINDSLHADFGIKNLYHRMIFTACALVAKRFGVNFQTGNSYDVFQTKVKETIERNIKGDMKRNDKLKLLLDVFNEIKMNLNVDTDDAKEQKRVIEILDNFISQINSIAHCLESSTWNGEDVMGIFFNEFNRYKKKSEHGQVFTPEHIADFMYQLLGCEQDDKILDAACGSGTFLAKAMSNMLRSAHYEEEASKRIKREQLFGIENDRELFALACANMLIHKDGKTNLAQMDARTEQAAKWIKDKGITKVLMNPPFEDIYGCLEIVLNVLDSVGNAECAFILPDLKLEKANRKILGQILDRHCLQMIVKLPKNLFFNVNTEASIFVFKAGKPQKKRDGQENGEIITYYLEDDGFVTVKNKGRHDVYGKWAEIRDRALREIRKRENVKWISPPEAKTCAKTAKDRKTQEERTITQYDVVFREGDRLSYDEGREEIALNDLDFCKTALEYVLFQNNVSKDELNCSLIDMIWHASNVHESDECVTITIPKGRKNENALA